MKRPPFSDLPDSTASPAYTDNPRVESAALASSAISMHSLEHDIDYDDELPAYTDEPETPIPPATTVPDHDTHTPVFYDTVLRPQYSLFPLSRASGPSNPYGTRDPLFSEDPEQLRRLILSQAAMPPRPFIVLQGSHTEQRENNGKKESHQVSDFDITVDGSELFPPRPIHTALGLTPPLWHELHTVPDHAKAHRGGLFARRAKFSMSDIDLAHDIPAYDDQTLKIWSHLFCSRAARSWFPYTFTIRRRITAWDTTKLETRLSAMLRMTNYRGHVTVSFPVEDQSFTVYSAHWVNIALANKWIWWACVVLQLWILTWPMLWLCTGRFEVVHVDWPYMKQINGQAVYLSYDEEQWLDTWGQTVIDAAFSRRKATLNHVDLERVMQLQRATRENAQRVVERQQSDNAVVNTVLGIVHGLSESRTQYDLVHGWGGDDAGASVGWRNRAGKTFNFHIG